MGAAAPAGPIAAGIIRERNVSHATGSGRLITVPPVSVTLAGVTLEFFAKDVYVDDKKGAILPPEYTSFNVWDDDERLIANGLEWRLTLPAGKGQDALKLGRNELPFMGFRLEPLRLKSFGLSGEGKTLKATIGCRLSLGQASGQVHNANYVEIELEGSAAGMTGKFVQSEVAFPLETSTLRAEYQATLGHGFNFGNQKLRVEYAGCWFELQAHMNLQLPGSPVVRIDATQVPEIFKNDAWFGLTKASVTISSNYPTTLDATPGLRLWQDGAEVFSWDQAGATKLLGKLLTIPETIPDNSLRYERNAIALQLHQHSDTIVFTGRVTNPNPAPKTDKPSQPSIAVGVFLAHVSNFALPLDTATIRLRVQCQKNKEEDAWQGTASVNGKITVTNAIEWPEFTWQDPATIPVPQKNLIPNSGRTTVEMGESRRTHKVIWHFQNHQLPLGLAAKIVAKDKEAAWQTVVRAEHTLLKEDKEVLKWSSVEVIAMGSPEALIPKFDNYGSPDRQVTFAGRYKNTIQAGAFAGPEPGMLWPGLGELARVLHGHLGEAFRTVFWKQGEIPSFIIVGGFIGLIGSSPLTSLLRVPVIAGINTLTQDGLAKCEVAWADGPAAPEVAWQYEGGSVVPVTGEQSELEAAIQLGEHDPRLALAVEQFFVPAPLPANWNSPFFLSSAISIERAIRKETAVDSRSLSLVAAREANNQRSAVALELASTPPGAMPPQKDTKFFVIGKQVEVETWLGPSTTGQNETLMSVLRARAGAIEVQPRAGILLRPDGTANAVVFAPTQLVRPRPPKIKRVYADLGRGHLYSANSPGADGWLQPPCQGHSSPLRDDTSGLAGIAGTAGLPKQATPEGSKNAIWLSHSRMPVYLPLQIEKLIGPTIGWLTPAPPLVRLPINKEIKDALKNVEAEQTKVQPFLPSGIDALDVSSRSGILFAERFRLLANLSRVGAFDPQFSRFGRPAQAGSSFVRKLRTPRPGPLPANEDVPDNKSNRRVQASLVKPSQPPEKISGSANIIQGGKGEESWAITVVAGALEAQLDRQWDGELMLVCSVKSWGGVIPPDPWDFLCRKLLFGETKAWLQVGLLKIRFATLQYAPLLGELTTGRVRLILRLPQPIDEQLPLFRTTLSGAGPLPDITLHWLVTPGDFIGAVPNPPISITLKKPDDPPIAGRDNAPVTVCFPLYPINPDRGSLPLVPTTLLFTDPAYNRDLSSIPHADLRAIQGTTNLLAGRGALVGSLMADASKVSRQGSLTLLYDVRFEKRLSELEQLRAEKPELPGGGLAAAKVLPGGDLANVKQPTILLFIQLLKKEGGKRIKFRPITIEIGKVYEVPLPSLIARRNTAVFAAGDRLQLTATCRTGVTPTLYSILAPVPVPAAQITRILQIGIIDGPAFEPPPARYDVFMELDGNVSAPLQAQSPLPARVEINEAALGFRRGMIDRVATFVWTLLRPRTEESKMKLFVVKGDRNGQTSIPKRT